MIHSLAIGDLISDGRYICETMEISIKNNTALFKVVRYSDDKPHAILIGSLVTRNLELMLSADNMLKVNSNQIEKRVTLGELV